MLATISRRGSRSGLQFICSSCLSNPASHVLPLASTPQPITYPGATTSQSFSTFPARNQDNTDAPSSPLSNTVSATNANKINQARRHRLRTRNDRLKNGRAKHNAAVDESETASAASGKEPVEVAAGEGNKKSVKAAEATTERKSSFVIDTSKLRGAKSASTWFKENSSAALEKNGTKGEPKNFGMSGETKESSKAKESKSHATKAPKKPLPAKAKLLPKTYGHGTSARAKASIKAGMKERKMGPGPSRRIALGEPLVRRIIDNKSPSGTHRVMVKEDPMTMQYKEVSDIFNGDPSKFMADLNIFSAGLGAASPDVSLSPENARGNLVELIQSGKLKGDQRLEAIKLLRRLLIVKPAAHQALPPAPDEQGKDQSLKTALLQGTSSRPLSYNAPSSRGGFGGKELKPKRDISRPLKNKSGTKEYEIESIDSSELKLVPLESDGIEVPKLAYGLDRVLFNPGVYQLQDPRSKVYNFDPYLQQIMPTTEFDFNALAPYITSSRDKVLLHKTRENKKKYTGSTSSMTSALAHFHFLLSAWRPITTGNLSKQFPVEYETFTALQRSPTAIFLRQRDGAYAIDADKQYDSANVLMMLGKSMEKLLTLSTEEFEKYRRGNSHQISEETRNAPESFHYTTHGDFLLRSQLDAYDPRLPGTGMFDLKTRAVIAVRMDTESFEEGRGYQIRNRVGEWESYEREYFDMIRAAFLKYSLQVRMGRMDGIFVAFHNTTKIFGFQYISLPEMDLALHGTEDTSIGDSEFKLSLELLNRVFDRATAKFPGESLRFHFETRDAVTPFMYIFAEPVSEERIEQIQNTKRAHIEEFERRVCGIAGKDLTDEDRKAAWDNIRADVADSMKIDEQTPDESEDVDDPVNFSSSSLAAEELDNAEEIVDDVEGEEAEGEEALLEGEAETTEDVEGQEGVVSEVEEGEGAALETDADETESLEETIEESEDIETSSEATSELGEDLERSEPSSTEATEVDEASIDEATDNDITIEDSDAEDTEPLFSTKSLEPRRMLGMTLTIRNKVGNDYVERPERGINRTPKSKWTVEYALEDMNEANTLKQYGAVTLRRKKTHTKNVDMASVSTWNDLFIQTLKRLSSEGKLWREKEDAKERRQPVKTLYPMNGLNVMGRPEGEDEKVGRMETIEEESGEGVEEGWEDEEPKQPNAPKETALGSLRRNLEGK